MGNITNNGKQDALPVIAVDVSGNYVAFDTTTGNVVGPASAVSGDIAIYNGATGKILSDSGILSTNIVQGPASATSNAVAVYNGATGKLIKDSTLTFSGGILGSSAGLIIVAGIGMSLNSTAGMTLDASTGDVTLQADAGKIILNSTSGITTNGTFLPSNTSTDNLGSSAKHYSSIFVDSIGNGLDILGNVNVSGSITTRLDIVPLVSGTATVGEPAIPFSGVYANQYATTQISGVTTGTTLAVNWNNGSSRIVNFLGGVSGTCTITLSNGIAGSSYALQTINNTSGTTQVAWGGSNILWQGGTSGTTTATASAVDLFTFYYNGTKYLGNYNSNYA